MDMTGRAELADAERGGRADETPGDGEHVSRGPSEGGRGDGHAAPEPEPEARPHPEVPFWLAQVPYALVLSALVAGIVVVAAAHFKRGPAIIAGALLLAAAFRAVLPRDWIGLLAVRRRWIDLATCVGLAVLLIVLAWVAPQLTS
ncbi:hypothetical protein BJF83_05035 [Nocardiopsis sp. CNR-923]|uniref:DUF3017 domain-containing protein n=1 Tax=Nocardiopsis sp. CNR-923 TaxID=1904965 RepID=UPI000961A1A6|nr:DUF3017 domain-containing protein [Nocardiopsis sp. CNR-923]OLT25612.1 hypothetical protein BJF83_05035 [Nocardiopsis sp. CNR-923]